MNKRRSEPSTSLPQIPKLNAKVLLVDDSNFNQTVVGALLERAGCFVTTANNGEEAFEKFKVESSFDVILMDLTMPIVRLMIVISH